MEGSVNDVKKFLIAATASLLLLGGQAGAEASTPDEVLNTQVAETQDTSKWAHFRDKYLLNRENDRKRRERERREWERQRRRDYDRHDYDRRRPTPPLRRGDDRGGTPPPPLPPRPGYGAPPPPPPRR